MSFLRERDFASVEGSSPLYKTNNGYLEKNLAKAWRESRSWASSILNENGDEKKGDDFSYLDKQTESNLLSTNYGLRKIDRPERIFVKDAVRTFLTESKRQILITVLTMIKSQLGDYQQTISYVSGILLTFYDVETVFKMLYILGRSPFYSMNGYWRSEAIDQAIDAFVFWRLLKIRNKKLYNYLSLSGDCPVTPDQFIQKWFGGLGVQCIPTRFLLKLWSNYFKYGFRYLFKFYLNLIDCLTDSLIGCGNVSNPSQILEILRLEKKQRFWLPCVNEAINGYVIKLYSVSKYGNESKNGQINDECKENKKEEETYRFNTFKFEQTTFESNSFNFGNGNNSKKNNNNNKANKKSNKNSGDILIKPIELIQGTKYDNINRKNINPKDDHFGIILFFTKVFALSDVNDIRNDYIDKLDFTKEREYAWKEHLKNRLTNAAVSNTFAAMKIGEDEVMLFFIMFCIMCEYDLNIF